MRNSFFKSKFKNIKNLYLFIDLKLLKKRNGQNLRNKYKRNQHTQILFAFTRWHSIKTFHPKGIIDNEISLKIKFLPVNCLLGGWHKLSYNLISNCDLYLHKNLRHTKHYISMLNIK